MFLAIVFWFIMGIGASHFAVKRGRDPFAWFFLGAFFGLIAIVVLFILKPIKMEKSDGVEEVEIIPKSVVNLPVDYQRLDWYYIDSNREQVGPNSFETLIDLIKNMEIHNHTYLWCEGMDDWEKAEFLGMV